MRKSYTYLKDQEFCCWNRLCTKREKRWFCVAKKFCVGVVRMVFSIFNSSSVAGIILMLRFCWSSALPISEDEVALSIVFMLLLSLIAAACPNWTEHAKNRLKHSVFSNFNARIDTPLHDFESKRLTKQIYYCFNDTI